MQKKKNPLNIKFFNLFQKHLNKSFKVLFCGDNSRNVTALFHLETSINNCKLFYFLILNSIFDSFLIFFFSSVDEFPAKWKQVEYNDGISTKDIDFSDIGFSVGDGIYSVDDFKWVKE